MPILVLLLAFAALVYGAIRAFDAIAAWFGTAVALGAAVAAIALLVALAAWWWRRRREVAPNLGGQGDWTHRVAGEWGEARLAAGKRLVDMTVNGAHGAYIFADLRGARADSAGGWHVALSVADAKHPQWRLPMPNEREAKRWARIFSLAVAQRL
ncbi:hypothetical protein [Paraburkholderia sp. J41]|uniref:hypothetical protein n=1 Tax=Paraburkholderia sp. J41 TaxID=2805433 RepID=UPI002AC33319|nr:hypothetical protein [Paraburkholderia sp. J41]